MPDYDFQLSWHVDVESHPEWGSAPRGPLIHCDMAHHGELLDTVIGPDPLTLAPMVYYVLKCEYCILIHLWPLPPQAALDRWYSTQFYEHEKPDMLTRYQADAGWWMACVHGPLLETCAQALAPSSTDPVSLLDIGAGPGLLLRTAQARGWHTTAIEPSAVCALRLHNAGHTVWNGTLADYITSARGAQARYDVVTLYEVLEHASNPEEMLLQVYDLLAPGGVVAVCVPSDWTPAQLEACRRYSLPHWWVSAPAHCSMFTLATLKLMLRRCGFTICYTRMTYPLVEEFILKQGRNYVGDDDLGRACHQERMAYELHMVTTGRWAEVEAEYIAQVEHRIGREIVMIGRKP